MYNTILFLSPSLFFVIYSPPMKDLNPQELTIQIPVGKPDYGQQNVNTGQNTDKKQGIEIKIPEPAGNRTRITGLDHATTQRRETCIIKLN